MNYVAFLSLMVIKTLAVTLQSVENRPFLQFSDSYSSNQTFKGKDCHKHCNETQTQSLFKCSCDPSCSTQGTCCIDAVADVSSYQHWECQRTSKTNSYYTVSSCAKWWKTKEIEDLCLDHANEDPFLNVPVSSRTTNQTYRNVYCAVCNEDKNVTAWTITFLHWNCTFIDRCKFNFNPPHFVQKSGMLTSCNPYLVDRCSNNNHDARCHIYLAPMEATDGLVYKNKFCAVCNGASFSNLSCYVEMVIFEKRKKFYEMSVHTRFMPNVNSLSYSLLLDIDFINGGSIVGKREKCPPSHVYDPWRQQCRNIICPNSGRYYEGECHSDIKDILQNVTCLYVLYKGSEFTIKENGTLLLIETNTMLRSTDYIQLNKSTILVCITPGTNDIMKFGADNGLLTLICTCISLFCLFLKMVLHLCSKKTKKTSSTIICCLSFVLFIAQLLFLVANHFSQVYQICAFAAIVIHYAFLSSFFWTNILSYDIWRTFSTFGNKRYGFSTRRMLRYSIYGWVVPGLLVSLSVLFDFVIPPTIVKPNYGVVFCWISNKMALLIFFAGPMAVLLVINLTFYIITTMNILNLSRDSKIAHKNSSVTHKVQFILYVKLALIMGLTWVIGFVAAFLSSDILWYLFSTFNGLQGVYILVAFTRFRLSISYIRKKFTKDGKKMSVTSRSTQCSSISSRV